MAQIKAERQKTAGHTRASTRPSAWLEHKKQERRGVRVKARGQTGGELEGLWCKEFDVFLELRGITDGF